jgi:hypothetical protein
MGEGCLVEIIIVMEIRNLWRGVLYKLGKAVLWPSPTSSLPAFLQRSASAREDYTLCVRLVYCTESLMVNVKFIFHANISMFA